LPALALAKKRAEEEAAVASAFVNTAVSKAARLAKSPAAAVVFDEVALGCGCAAAPPRACLPNLTAAPSDWLLLTGRT